MERERGGWGERCRWLCIELPVAIYQRDVRSGRIHDGFYLSFNHLLLFCHQTFVSLYVLFLFSHLKSSNEIDTIRTNPKLDWTKYLGRQCAFFGGDCTSLTKDAAADPVGFENIALEIAPTLRMMQGILNGDNTATKGGVIDFGAKTKCVRQLYASWPSIGLFVQINTWSEPSTLASLCKRQLYLWEYFLGCLHYFGGFITRQRSKDTVLKETWF